MQEPINDNVINLKKKLISYNGECNRTYINDIKNFILIRVILFKTTNNNNKKKAVL